jgi:hypothetical protein
MNGLTSPIDRERDLAEMLTHDKAEQRGGGAESDGEAEEDDGEDEEEDEDEDDEEEPVPVKIPRRQRSMKFWPKSKTKTISSN